MEDKKSRSSSTGEGGKQKGGVLLEALRVLSPFRQRRLTAERGSMKDIGSNDEKHSFISPRVREMSDFLRSASLESQRLLEHSSGAKRPPVPAASTVSASGEAKSVAETSVVQDNHMSREQQSETSEFQQQPKAQDVDKDLHQHPQGASLEGLHREEHQDSLVAGQFAGQGGLRKALAALALSERGPQAEEAFSIEEATLLSTLESQRDGLQALDGNEIEGCASLRDDEVAGGGEVGSFTSDGGFYCSPRPRLVLHVDINKTILIRDQAQDAGSDSMVNVLLSECAWGRMMPGPKWIPVGRLATDRPAADPDLMTYRSYLDGFLLPFQRGFGKDIDKMNDGIKVKRQARKRCFTSPGEPGEMFRGVYEQLMTALQVPGEQAEAMRRMDVGDGKEIMLLPSFFELLKHLQARDREFAIVFRTFGTDALEIIRELNLFCSGQHPLHPGVRMDGSDGKTDLRLAVPESCGCFYRHGLGSDGTLLAMGVPDHVMSARVVGPHKLEPIADELQLNRNFNEIYGALNERCWKGQNTALALRDYYPWWKSHQERAKTGKLMLVDRSDFTVHQIFLDDNVGFGNPHIVDVRDLDTGNPVPFSESIGKYIVKVEPLNAILDSQYFIRAVRRCEEERNANHYALSRSQSQPLLVKPSKWRSARIGVLSVVRLAANR